MMSRASAEVLLARGASHGRQAEASQPLQTTGAHMSFKNASAIDIVNALGKMLGVESGPIRIEGADPITCSRHRIGDASAASIALFGQQIAAIAGSSETVGVRIEQAIDALRASFLFTVNGLPWEYLDINPAGTRLPAGCKLSDFYRTKDDRWIYLSTDYPNHRDALFRVLKAPPIRDRFVEAIGHWNGFALEDALAAAGGVASVVRNASEWRDSDAGKASMAHPVIRLERIGDAEPRPLSRADRWPPLNGLRVLDLTHIIAGPFATKLMATFGANVLHVSRPDLPDFHSCLVLANGGKRNAYCDLRDSAQADQLRSLCTDADVFVHNYQGLDARGFGAEELARLAPGIVVLEISCYGFDGPWAVRGGFDGLAQNVTGFTETEGRDGVPSYSPTLYLNDYLAGWFGAAGVLAALRRRANEGGSWRVRIDLARVCTWVQELGVFPEEIVRDLPPPGAPNTALHATTGPFGTTLEPVVPLDFGLLRTPTPQPATLLGTAPLKW